jgi:hypothetical protein
LKSLDPRLRGDDEKNTSATFYELIFSATRKKMNNQTQGISPDRPNLSNHPPEAMGSGKTKAPYPSYKLSLFNMTSRGPY